jgi:TRAP transporter TAXI family solute receptor
VINKSSQGAAANFEQLANPKSNYKIALMQADYLYMMQGRDLKYNTDKTKTIKVLLPLASEEIHMVTKAGSGIKTLGDLKGKLVAIGTKSQGTYATATMINEKSKTYWNSRNIHFDDALKSLKLNRIQAFMIVGGAPIEKLNFNPAVSTEDITLVELYDDNGWAKYYTADTIKKEDYRWLEADVPTFSVRTLLLVNEAKLTQTDLDNLAKMVDGIQMNLETLKENGHPKWKEVDFSNWDAADWPVYEFQP